MHLVRLKGAEQAMSDVCVGTSIWGRMGANAYCVEGKSDRKEENEQSCMQYSLSAFQSCQMTCRIGTVGKDLPHIHVSFNDSVPWDVLWIESPDNKIKPKSRSRCNFSFL